MASILEHHVLMEVSGDVVVVVVAAAAERLLFGARVYFVPLSCWLLLWESLELFHCSHLHTLWQTTMLLDF